MRTRAIRMGAGAVALTLLAGCGSGVVKDPYSSTDGAATTTSVTTLPVATPPREWPSGAAAPIDGLVPTTTRVLASGEVTCPPPAGPTVTVRSPAPGSPTLTVAVPEGFTEVTPHAAAVRLTGPTGMAAEITLTPTTSTARAAFEQYTDARAGDSPVNSVSALPGDLCGYSGQKLTGVLADKGTDFADRIVHLWTNSGDFLAVVRLEAPSGTPGFDEAESQMLDDFGIAMPGGAAR